MTETRSDPADFQTSGRVSTGIDGVDRVLGGGLLPGRSTLVRGKLRKVIGVLKKRTSDYEKRFRTLEITEHGLKVGDPLPELRGLLTGTPEWHDDTGKRQTNVE